MPSRAQIQISLGGGEYLSTFSVILPNKCKHFLTPYTPPPLDPPMHLYMYMTLDSLGYKKRKKTLKKKTNEACIFYLIIPYDQIL